MSGWVAVLTVVASFLIVAGAVLKRTRPYIRHLVVLWALTFGYFVALAAGVLG
jgi:hypothetical protein